MTKKSDNGTPPVPDDAPARTDSDAPPPRPSDKPDAPADADEE